MSWRWLYQSAEGAQVPGPDVTFDNQTDAEEWLSHEWPDLLDDGVATVTLLDGPSEVYGPMSLQP